MRPKIDFIIEVLQPWLGLILLKLPLSNHWFSSLENPENHEMQNQSVQSYNNNIGCILQPVGTQSVGNEAV